MSKGRILVVEDDFDISNMLRIYFTGQGYQVEVAARGSEALSRVRKRQPDLIVLDIMLPDMDGYAVCRTLRTTTRTSHIPIIFLTQKDERSDKIAGLELGADDYITKPFDIEELKLRVRSAIRAHQRLNMTDPKTGLPSGQLIEDQLRSLIGRGDWAFVLVNIDYLNLFSDAYGFVAGSEVLRFASMVINDAVNRLGTEHDFVGQASDGMFAVITFAEQTEPLLDFLIERFEADSLTHYSFIDAERGAITLPDGTTGPLMSLSFGIADGREQQFADIREITETAAKERRRFRDRHAWANAS